MQDIQFRKHSKAVTASLLMGEQKPQLCWMVGIHSLKPKTEYNTRKTATSTDIEAAGLFGPSTIVGLGFPSAI